MSGTPAGETTMRDVGIAVGFAVALLLAAGCAARRPVVLREKGKPFVYLAVDRDAVESWVELRTLGRGKRARAFLTMMSEGKLFPLPSGTAAEVLDEEADTVKVRVRSGDEERVGWTLRRYVE